MALHASRALRLIVRCLAVAIVADVADGKSAGLRHVVELGAGLLALLCPSIGTLLVLAASYLGVTLTAPFASWYVHHYIAAALHAVVCASALLLLLTQRRLPSERELLELVRAPLRLVACAVFFAGLLAGAGLKSEIVKSVPWVELKVGGALGVAMLVEQRRGLGVVGPWVYAWLGPGLLMVMVVGGAVVLAARSERAAVAPETRVVPHRWARVLLLIVPLALLGNEARLYLGWPSGRPALRMAANLIANEHETNHLLLSRLPRLALGGPWGVRIEPPYPMRQQRVLCGKPEPGLSARDTERHMRQRLAHDRLASGG